MAFGVNSLDLLGDLLGVEVVHGHSPLLGFEFVERESERERKGLNLE